jgi:hypothetical protein
LEKERLNDNEIRVLARLDAILNMVLGLNAGSDTSACGTLPEIVVPRKDTGQLRLYEGASPLG